MNVLVKPTLPYIITQTGPLIISFKTYCQATPPVTPGENLTDENIELKQESHLVSRSGNQMFNSVKEKTFCSRRISTCGLFRSQQVSFQRCAMIIPVQINLLFESCWFAHKKQLTRLQRVITDKRCWRYSEPTHGKNIQVMSWQKLIV